MAMETAAQNPGPAGAGMGMALGFMMPALWLDYLKKNEPPVGSGSLECPECHQPCGPEARFCPACGNESTVYL